MKSEIFNFAWKNPQNKCVMCYSGLIDTTTKVCDICNHRYASIVSHNREFYQLITIDCFREDSKFIGLMQSTVGKDIETKLWHSTEEKLRNSDLVLGMWKIKHYEN